ncbi:MAG: hypothetical protein ABH807_03180 [Candidatus Shapirobacteria bacterium]
MINSKFKNIFGLALFLLVALSIPLATGLIKQRQEIRKQAASDSGTGTIRLDPAMITKHPGDFFDVAIKFKTGDTETATISSLTIRLTYPYTGATPELDIVGPDGNPVNQITPNPSLMAGGDWSMPIKSVTRANNFVTIDIAALNTNIAGYRSINEATLTTLRFKINRATANPIILTFDTTESKMMTKTEPITDILKIPANATYTLTDAETPPTPTTTASPNAIILRFSVKFQGVETKKGYQQVKIRVYKKGVVDRWFDYHEIDGLLANDTGIYSGVAILSNVPAGDNYTIFIKGPKHLARKFCTNNQENRCVGGGQIALTAGQNTFDFSKIGLEAGDVPLQDGVCDVQDYSRVKNLRGNPEAVALAIGDLNLDGIVNTSDTNMMRETLATKYEEDY